MSLTKQLREVGAILGLNCGDNSCMFSERTGAGTNGGCQCDLVAAVKRLENERLVAQVKLNLFAAREPFVERLLDAIGPLPLSRLNAAADDVRDYGKMEL